MKVELQSIFSDLHVIVGLLTAILEISTINVIRIYSKDHYNYSYKLEPLVSHSWVVGCPL